MKLLFFASIVCLKILLSESANILGIFHFPSYSHHIVYQKVVKDLSARGHHLTILTVKEINENYPNVTEILMGGSEGVEELNLVESKEKKFGVLKLFKILATTLMQRTEIQLAHPKVKQLIHEAENYKFDLILLEYVFKSPHIWFSELYNCPIVTISSMDVTASIHEKIGNYLNPTIHPDMLLSYEHGNLNLIQRFKSTLLHIATTASHSIGEYYATKIVRKHFPYSKMSLSEMEDRIEFLLMNTNPIIGNARPITQNTILLGNLHIEPAKELNGSLKSILDSSQNGVIYMSFGSNIRAKDLNERILSIFLSVFSKLKFDILWKFESDERLTNKSSNVFTSKWFPQADLLAHPNVKLFITQCGQQSLEEAIDRTVPMVAIPFHVDQYQNSYKIKNEKIGVFVEFDELSEENFYAAIMEATQPSYKVNIRKFKQLMYDVPMQSREKAVWWIEYALRNKGMNRLKYKGAKVPFYQLYCLDVVAIACALLITLRKVYCFVVKSCVVKSKKIKSE